MVYPYALRYKKGKANLDISSQKLPNAEEIIVDYNILVNRYRKLLNYQIHLGFLKKQEIMQKNRKMKHTKTNST